MQAMTREMDEPAIAKRAQVMSAARGMVGTPYMHQARLPGIGIDCAGVLICVCWELGLLPRSFDVKGYGPMPDGKALKALCDANMTPIPQSAIQPGDAILVGWMRGPAQHLGIIVDHPYPNKVAMVHALGPRKPASGGKARVIETRVEFGRSMQFVAAYSLPGIV